MPKIKQATKHTGRAQKEQIVAELVEKLDNSSALVLADYQGLKHKQLEDLKKELKKLDATIVVTKNSLLRLSLGKSKNFADYKDNKSLDRPTAALFIQADYVEPLKKLAKVIKAFGLPKIKLGILEGQALNAAGVLKIASLPNRETLLAQLVRTLNSPIQGLVVTLNAPISQLAMVLNAISQNKPSAPAPVSEPVQTETPTQVTEEPASTDQPTAEPVATEQTTELPLADVNDAMPEASESAATSDVATPASAEASAGEPASDETKPTKETKEEEQTSEGGEQTK